MLPIIFQRYFEDGVEGGVLVPVFERLPASVQ